MKSRHVFLILLSGYFLLTGCSAGNGGIVSGGGTGSTGNQTPAVIATSADGADAAALILQSKELAVTGITLFRNLGFIAQSQMVSAASGTGTGTCVDYGTYDYTRTYNSNGSYTLAFTFSLCRDNDFQYDGTYTANGTPAQFTGRLSGLNMLNFKNGYTTLIGSLVGSNLSYQMAGSGDASNGTYTFTVNGGMSAFDYYSLGQHTMGFIGLLADHTITTDVVSNIHDTSIVTSGRYSVRRSSATTAITYTNFSVNARKHLLTNSEDVSINGRITVDRTPNAGIEGIFDVVTAVPVRTVLVPYPPTTTQGTLTANAAATIQYGAANAIDVSVAGDAPVAFTKEFMLLRSNDFYAMEQQLPIVSGTTGTASGSIMSISALSTGPTSSELNCFTDVHVSYFNTTSPTIATPITWFVHWASGMSTCVPQTTIPFQEATSSTGVATDPCDMGLDINGSATDITSGGVEHFLAANLPTGYYILSVNNYSCATTVGNAATVIIGDYLFGPYTCVYSTWDGDGNSPGAWCRLADVRVNAGGTIDVIAPDALLNPWHP